MSTSPSAAAAGDPAAAGATIERWRAEADAIKARIQPPGVGDVRAFAGRPGIELFHAMLAGEVPPPPIGHTLDFTLVEAEYGRVVFQGRPSKAHYNPLGTVHGGWYATLLDSALACAVHSALPAGRYTTVELKINLVKALTDKVPLVRAEGKLIHLGRRMGVSEARLVGPDGALYAHGTSTCFVMEAG